MKRNDIINEAGRLANVVKARAAQSNDPKDWSLVGRLESFANDLCHVPNKHNMELGLATYTMPMAKRTLAELKARAA